MKVRFLADADLNKAIVSGVLRREPSADFLSAREAGLQGMNDLESSWAGRGTKPRARFARCWYDARAFPHLQGQWKTQFGRIPHSTGPRCWDGNRRPGADLGRKAGSGRTGWDGCRCKFVTSVNFGNIRRRGVPPFLAADRPSRNAPLPGEARPHSRYPAPRRSYPPSPVTALELFSAWILKPLAESKPASRARAYIIRTEEPVTGFHERRAEKAKINSLRHPPFKYMMKHDL